MIRSGSKACNLLSFLLRCGTRPHEWGTQMSFLPMNLFQDYSYAIKRVKINNYTQIVKINILCTLFPNLYAWNKPRWVDMQLQSINQHTIILILSLSLSLFLSLSVLDLVSHNFKKQLLKNLNMNLQWT